MKLHSSVPKFDETDMRRWFQASIQKISFQKHIFLKLIFQFWLESLQQDLTVAFQTWRGPTEYLGRVSVRGVVIEQGVPLRLDCRGLDCMA